MRFIPTTASKVESLKKQAKSRQRSGGGKYATLLDNVARGAGYDHWHHVTLCFRETEGAKEERSLLGTIEHVVQAESGGEVVIVGTGPDTSSTQPFLIFSTGIGDAWVLDPLHDQACCLVWQGVRQSPEIRETTTRIEILWDGNFSLQGAFFEVQTTHPDIGNRMIAGYPVEALREFLLPGQPVEDTIAEVFGQEDAIELTPDLIKQLEHSGWLPDDLKRAARHGGRYSPSRNTVLFPALSNRT